jgi:TonB-linked SusC/RagA family outer membrane protein
MNFTITKNRQKPKWLLLLLFIMLIQIHANAQSVNIAGNVTDETGQALPGVNVKVKGTTIGAATDANGKYTLRLDNSRFTLIFSYLGYVTQEIPVNGQTFIDVKMVADPKSLKEVVVIGYGTQKRENVTDAITTVKASEFNNGNINDPITLIEGKVAGLAISRSGGSDPNALADFQLRGPSTVFGGSTQPLLVIDGVPGGDLEMIAPQDIASIDVLKDASASSIYGARASGGVIIVTTKKGRPGTSTITYDGTLSTDLISKNYQVLDASQYLALAKQYKKKVKNEKANTNWFDELTRTPVNTTHNLAINGGDAKTTYYASVDYKNLEGLDLVNTRRFVEGHARVNTKALNDKLNFTVEFTNSFDNKNFGNSGNIAQTLNMNPTFPVYNPDGTYYQNPGDYNLQTNPVASELLNTNNDIEKRFQGTADISYDIFSGFKANVNYNTRREDYLNSQYASSQDFLQSSSGENGTAYRNEYNITDNVVQGTLSYDKQIKKHSFNLVAGYSYQDTFDDSFYAGNNNFPSDATLYYNLGAGQALTDFTLANRGGVVMGSSATENQLESFFGRVIYNYDEKYLFKASIRRDGSSKLAAGHKFANFYGASAGWVISKENFLQDNKTIKFLKLRGSYGTTGNEQGLIEYQSLYLLNRMYTGDAEGLTFPQDGYIGNGTTGTWVPSYGPTNNTNPDLEWETQRQIDIGLDFSLFHDSWLTGTIDVYDKRINNLLGTFSAQVPSNIFSSIYANAGSFQDRGIELALNATFVKNSKFTWMSSFTAAYNKNKVLSLSSSEFHGSAESYGSIDGANYAYRLAPGEPTAEFYGRVFAGFAKDGSWLFRNAAGQAVPDGQLNPATDYKYLGSGLPTTNLSFTNTFRYGNFDASIMLRSALGFKAFNAKRLIHENLGQITRTNFFTSVVNDPNTLVKNADQTFSSYYLENGDYMKIDNLSIGYTIPMKQGSSIKRLRVSFIAQNLFTFTGFSGVDPEQAPLSTSIDSNPNDEGLSNPGIEPLYNYYPATRTLSLGLSATF